MCLDSTGKGLYAFGRSCSGELGHVATIPPAGSFESTPIKVYLEYDSNGNPKENPEITKISCGGHHCFAQTRDGDVYSWGYAFNGALGLGKVLDDCVPLPKKIDVVKGINTLRENQKQPPVKATVHMVAGGGQHSALVATLQVQGK